MTYIIPSTRHSSRTDHPCNSGRRAKFARQMVFAEFGYRHARALGEIDFVDRRPDEIPMHSPDARFQ